LPQPILNRIDLQLQLSAENEVVLTDSGRAEESSQKVAARIGAAREIQIKRGKLNGVLSLRELERFAPLAAELADFFNTAVHSLELSPREQLKVWRVARTIADLEGCVNLSRGHLAEAVSYRLPKDISNNGNS
jgi:magnesium chelatase family protein